MLIKKGFGKIQLQFVKAAAGNISNIQKYADFGCLNNYIKVKTTKGQAVQIKIDK